MSVIHRVLVSAKKHRPNTEAAKDMACQLRGASIGSTWFHRGADADHTQHPCTVPLPGLRKGSVNWRQFQREQARGKMKNVDVDVELWELRTARSG